jgi:hypothetical protein
MEDFTEAAPEYSVSIWEVIAIAGGAILIVAAGLIGLGAKALSNAFDSQRAEAIARSLMTYEIPGGSKGLLGANIGGGKVAVVASTATVSPSLAVNPAVKASAAVDPVLHSPEVELFLARIPLSEPDRIPDDSEPPLPQNPLFSGFSFSYSDPLAFQVRSTQSEQKPFCGTTVPVIIQQGSLTVTTGAAPIPAIKYEIGQMLNTKSRIVVISALGNQAAAKATTVFNSLACH